VGLTKRGSMAIEEPRRYSEHLPLSSVHVKVVRSYNSAPLYVCMMSHFIKYSKEMYLSMQGTFFRVEQFLHMFIAYYQNPDMYPPLLNTSAEIVY
jgi:hypothetical protein